MLPLLKRASTIGMINDPDTLHTSTDQREDSINVMLKYRRKVTTIAPFNDNV